MKIIKSITYEEISRIYVKYGKKPFLVYDLDRSLTLNLHSIELEVPEKGKVWLGLRARRTFSNVRDISAHVSRSLKWDVQMHAKQITWKPTQLVGKRSGGQFLIKENLPVDESEMLEMKLPKPPDQEMNM